MPLRGAPLRRLERGTRPRVLRREDGEPGDDHEDARAGQHQEDEAERDEREPNDRHEHAQAGPTDPPDVVPPGSHP